MNDRQLITYHPSYKNDFIRLNTEWLEKYFTVEPHDQTVFDNIEEIIINNDGEIFFCKYDNEIAGTVAMQKINDTTYELAKMAVSEKFQGKGLSNLLMQACVDFARKKKASKIMLLSNRRLTPALTLYRKFGFKEVPMEETDYSRADIQMELDIS